MKILAWEFVVPGENPFPLSLAILLRKISLILFLFMNPSFQSVSKKHFGGDQILYYPFSSFQARDVGRRISLQLFFKLQRILFMVGLWTL